MMESDSPGYKSENREAFFRDWWPLAKEALTMMSSKRVTDEIDNLSVEHARVSLLNLSDVVAMMVVIIDDNRKDIAALRQRIKDMEH